MIRDIKGYEGKYAASSDGQIWSYPNHIHNGRWLKQNKNKKGYCFVCLVDSSGKKITRLVHRLVGENLLPNKYLKPEINHKNLNPSDNRIENLEWVTRSENLQHAWDNGAMIATPAKRIASRNNVIKSNRKRRKFTMRQAENMRNMVGSGKRKVNFYCKKYGVAAATIHQILNYESYAD